MPKCTLRFEVGKLTSDNAPAIKKLVDEYIRTTTWSPELAYRALTGASSYTLHYGTDGAIDIGRPDLAIPKVEAAIAKLLTKHDVSITWNNEIAGVVQRFTFVVSISGAPQSNHDQLHASLERWVTSLEIDGDVIVDLVGAPPKARVEAYTPAPVTIAGGWQKLEEECQQLDRQLRALIGKGKIRLERN